MYLSEHSAIWCNIVLMHGISQYQFGRMPHDSVNFLLHWKIDSVLLFGCLYCGCS